jgi:DnaJ-class molecular chaperone
MNWRIATIKQLEREFEECGFRYRVSLLVESVEQKFRKIENDYTRNRRKRIRSILRRLNRCVQCHGTGKVPELEERGGPWMEYNVLVWEECPACGGTGRVKEER